MDLHAVLEILENSSILEAVLEAMNQEHTEVNISPKIKYSSLCFFLRRYPDPTTRTMMRSLKSEKLLIRI